MKFKILSIGFYLDEKGIINESFYTAPSFSDYDVLIIDPIKISEEWKDIKPQHDGSLLTYHSIDGGFSKNIKEIMEQRADETKLLLEKTGGIVICFLREKGLVLNCKEESYDRYPVKIHRYSWLPSQELYWSYESVDPFTQKKSKQTGKYIFSKYFDSIPRFGQEIGEIDKTHPFFQYFTALKNEIYFEAVISSDNDIIKVAKPLAKNKVGEVIALELSFGKGKFIFLSPIEYKSMDVKKVSGILIDCIRKSLNWSQPLIKPIWINKYEFLQEREFQKKIDDFQTKIMSLDKEKQKIEEDKNKLEMLKGMLYEQGKYGLEPPIREAFRILGFKVLEREEYKEDYDLYAKEKNLEVIGEIEGSNNQIDIWKYRQLLDFVNNEVENGKKVKGILIGNAFIVEDPDKRTEQFTEKAILGCKRQKFCRITTYELFKAVRAVLSEPHDNKLKESIKQKILECEDKFKFD